MNQSTIYSLLFYYLIYFWLDKTIHFHSFMDREREYVPRNSNGSPNFSCWIWSTSACPARWYCRILICVWWALVRQNNISYDENNSLVYLFGVIYLFFRFTKDPFDIKKNATALISLSYSWDFRRTRRFLFKIFLEKWQVRIGPAISWLIVNFADAAVACWLSDLIFSRENSFQALGGHVVDLRTITLQWLACQSVQSYQTNAINRYSGSLILNVLMNNNFHFS